MTYWNILLLICGLLLIACAFRPRERLVTIVRFVREHFASLLLILIGAMLFSLSLSAAFDLSVQVEDQILCTFLGLGFLVIFIRAMIYISDNAV